MEENLTTVDAQLEKIANILQDILDILSGE
jgi:hypothetical protein